MKRRFSAIVVVGLLGATLTALLAARSAPEEPQTRSELAYHDHAPTEPVPATFDPSPFRDNHPAFVTYTLAAKLAETLYQVPCYCPCQRVLGHRSLLDCYTSKHGVHCPTCQKEVLFCYLERRKGKTPAQIREAIAKGKAAKLDLPKKVKRLYAELQKSQNSHLP